MNISIASYSFHGLLAEGRIDVFGYLESCRFRYGLRAADLWNGLVGTTDTTFLKKVRQAVEERDMVVVNYHVDGVHLWEDDPDARQHNYTRALEHLRAAEILGARTIRFDTGGRLEPVSDEQFDYLVARYREYANIAAGFGARIGPENHWGLSLIADNMERIARAVDHPAYGVLLHLGHWEDGDELGGDRRLAPWAMHTHIDARTTRTRLVEHLQILIDAGYTGYWGVEHHSAQNEYAEVACQLAEVQRVLARRQWEAHRAELQAPDLSQAGNPLLTAEQEGRA
ncbi:MAG: TIM barrel protein [Chloroherpetonaceae bacterium]|nr:sugar phosphate isomerase/epimerase [Chthonomonadaceae bacterium]MDW8206652.1 TIM barrel protein [Chloroherpetonaceae bacterium]